MKTVLCHGVFDVLHPGHFKLLEKARGLGEYLIVSITADRFVNKGKGRPVYKAKHRKEMLERIDGVGLVVVNKEANAVKLIRKLKPEVYVKGGDYAKADKHGFLEKERKEVEKHGGEFVMLQHFEGWSSSKVMERIRAAG